MKAKRAGEFKPITVEVTIETEEELDAITEMAKNLTTDEIVKKAAGDEISEQNYPFIHRVAVTSLIENVASAICSDIEVFHDVSRHKDLGSSSHDR